MKVECTRPATVGIVSMGSMGAAYGQILKDLGHEVIWASEGRTYDDYSLETHRRAEPFEDVGSLQAMGDRADVVLCVMRGDSATVAGKVCKYSSFKGHYVDANTKTEEECENIKAIVEAGGATYVDGCIIGHPPVHVGSNRMYVHSDNLGAECFVSLFEIDDVGQRKCLVRAIAGSPSLLKLAYTTYSSAVLAASILARRTTRMEGIEEEFLYEATEGFPFNPRNEDGSRRGLFGGW
tara:strand:- start:359 stop:1069 length:711 start_codon:yes stop_codon:yes gene_type:complete